MLRPLLVVLFSLFSAVFAYPEVYHVPDDFASINDALLSFDVGDGDVIVVRPGTYYENLNFMGKALTLISEEGPEVTVIDGGLSNCVVDFANWEGPDSVLAGFTITNGAGKPC